MPAKTEHSSPTLTVYRDELRELYARRSAIDSLIESLEEYARCAAPHLEQIKQLSA
jgi:hypothetical protein